MNKIPLIIRREYLSRVRNKTFIISTFLFPLVIVLFITGSTFLAIQGKEKRNIAVIDQNGFFKPLLKSDDVVQFTFDPAADTANYGQKGYTDALFIPKVGENGTANYILKSPNTISLTIKGKIEYKINTAIEDRSLQERGISRSVLDSIRNNSRQGKLITIGNEGKTVSSELSNMVGFASGILIYILTFVYGASVMRGVMEEKTNRIAEVIISSVKPFQLMLGKIVGIGLVGLTQFLMWVTLIFGLVMIAQAFIPHDVLKEVQQLQQTSSMGGGVATSPQVSAAAQAIFKTQTTFGTANWWLILSCFLFYFLGGYLFYSSLFAAVGSVVNEDPQEAQSLMMPITLPIIFSFIIMGMAIQNPNSSLAVWASIIPFSSPIVMMARIPFGVPGTVPYWQLGLSMLSLIGGFLFTTWLAGKIYRTGILLYGKKVTWRLMWKWAFKS